VEEQFYLAFPTLWIGIEPVEGVAGAFFGAVVFAAGGAGYGIGLSRRARACLGQFAKWPFVHLPRSFDGDSGSQGAQTGDGSAGVGGACVVNDDHRRSFAGRGAGLRAVS
jgi:hypothetical protein